MQSRPVVSDSPMPDRPPTSPDPSAPLRQRMQQTGIASFKALAKQAGVSEWQITQFRSGKGLQMRLEILIRISQALQISLTELLTLIPNVPLGQSAPPQSVSPPQPDLAQLQQEYQFLQVQMAQQRETLQQEFQQTALNTLESWMLNWPTAANAVRQNPQFEAAKLLPLVRPIENLLNQWGIGPIEAIGAEVPYDPQIHQLDQGTAQSGDRVRVSQLGYRQGDRLLFRARVKALATDRNG
ncbi:MAG: helix-turn-helix domain-containing protein [Leptolyngbyaceae cyanobacterium bins.59]|nr:helix-turn-helix domain-containing protein [Leptolyngbyaceae cyanobacterium bins.59]